MFSLEELERSMPDVPNVAAAVEQLVSDGVARRLGDLVGATRAAVRTAQHAI